MQRIFILMIAALIVSNCSKQEVPKIDEQVSKWITTTIDNAAKENRVEALSLGVHVDRVPPIFQSFGSLVTDQIKEINEQTIFPVSSLSKAFTGIIVNSLIEEKKLDYEEPVSTYLSELLNLEAKESFENVPLKNLLHHRSGITDSDCSFYNQTKGDTLIGTYTAEHLISDLNKIRIDSEDYRYAYSNFNYTIIGLICEKVSGQTYEELLQEYVVDKYGLPNTVARLSGATKERIVVSDLERRTNDLPAQIPLIMTPAEGIYSNISDLIKLQKKQIKSYQNYFERGIADPLLLTERTLRTKIDNWKYGNGFMVITNDNNKYFGYYRHTSGHASLYLFCTYPAAGITILSSSGGPWLLQSGLTILDGLVDAKYITRPKRRSLAWTLFSVINSDGTSFALEWYQKNKDSKSYHLTESEFNTVGYRLLREERFNEAIEVFKLNVANFPESSNVYDSLGEAYLDSGDEDLAKINYQKSLDLDPNNSRAKRALKQLQPEK